MVDLGVELDVDRESVPQAVARAGDEAHSELALEHEDSDAKDGTLGEELEDEGRGDLRRSEYS